MSRTIRIKNNYRETVQDCWMPRSVDPIHVYGYIDHDDCYSFGQRNAETKREYWEEWCSFHGEGHAYGNYKAPADFVYRYFNRKNRQRANAALRKHVKVAALDDDFFTPCEEFVSLIYF